MIEAGHSSDRVRIGESRTLADEWGVLRSYTVEYRRRDGRRQQLHREVYSRGDVAAVLLYRPRDDSVILTRQFRLPPFAGGHPDGMLLEAASGMLDGQAPAAAARREAEEETGYKPSEIIELFSAYMSPYALSDRTHFFWAEVDDHERLSPGGGVADEGEELDVVALPFEKALDMVARGEIVDGKTILLLQCANPRRSTVSVENATRVSREEPR